jgi:large subunit ribosomal protein L29
MKTSELRQKDTAGLQTEIKELQKAHFNMRMQKATQQITNTATLRIARRDIARAKTILVEKQSVETSAK